MKWIFYNGTISTRATTIFSAMTHSAIIHYDAIHTSDSFSDYFLVCVCVFAQSCPTLCDSMDCSLPGSSAHGIFQAKILERVAISFSRGSSWPGSNLHLLCWQVGSLPLYRLGSLIIHFVNIFRHGITEPNSIYKFSLHLKKKHTISSSF